MYIKAILMLILNHSSIGTTLYLTMTNWLRIKHCKSLGMQRRWEEFLAPTTRLESF